MQCSCRPKVFRHMDAESKVEFQEPDSCLRCILFEHDATVCKQVLAQKVLNLPCEVLGLL